jgi:Uma2 family endonuclease
MAIKETVATQTEPPRLKMSYEAFLEWADEDTHAEWVEGEVIIHMPVKKIHQMTLKFLLQLLSLFVDLFDLGEIQVAPYEMKAQPDGSSREPDILFVAKENLERLTEDRLVGPADLIIEIVSQDSVNRDRDDKFKEYAEAGVREYWIIDPRPGKQRADFFSLDETGSYRLFATEDDERVESRLLAGFWLKPAWLWQVDTLYPLTLFLEMRGIPPEQAQQIQQLLRAGPANTENE